jgi:hypothetical protein
LVQAQEQATTDLDKANQQVAELEQRVQTVSALETKNQQLQADLDSARMHVYILADDVAVACWRWRKMMPAWRASLSQDGSDAKDHRAVGTTAENGRGQERLALALKGIESKCCGSV